MDKLKHFFSEPINVIGFFLFTPMIVVVWTMAIGVVLELLNLTCK